VQRCYKSLAGLVSAGLKAGTADGLLEAPAPRPPPGCARSMPWTRDADADYGRLADADDYDLDQDEAGEDDADGEDDAVDGVKEGGSLVGGGGVGAGGGNGGGGGLGGGRSGVGGGGGGGGGGNAQWDTPGGTVGATFTPVQDFLLYRPAGGGGGGSTEPIASRIDRSSLASVALAAQGGTARRFSEQQEFARRIFSGSSSAEDAAAVQHGQALANGGGNGGNGFVTPNSVGSTYSGFGTPMAVSGRAWRIAPATSSNAL